MKIDLKLPPRTLMVISATLQPIYNSKPHTRKEKSALSIALDVTEKLDSKTKSISKQPTLFDDKKKLKISFKHHEADMLEIILLQQIRYIEDPYIKIQIQNTINLLNQISIMMNTKTLKKPTKKIESIFEAEHRWKNEAKEIAKKFVHIKPTKYLLK